MKNDFREVFKSGSNNNFHENRTTSLAMAAFIEKRVTLARAAELADESLSGFIDLLSKYNIAWLEYAEETFNEEQETLAELRKLTDDSNS